jgi:hypothetical protein
MVDKKSWEEFRESGLFWWINMILHTFGWAIVLNVDFDNGEEVLEVYPARVKFRGFDDSFNDEGYAKVTKRLKKDIDELIQEVED